MDLNASATGDSVRPARWTICQQEAIGKPLTSITETPALANDPERICSDTTPDPNLTATASLISSLLPSSRRICGSKLIPEKCLSNALRVPDPGSRKIKRSALSFAHAYST